MGGKSAPAQQTTINKTELPPWLDAAAQSNLAYANQVANMNLNSNYDPNKRYLGPGATTQGANTYFMQNMNIADPLYNEALSGIRGLMDYDAADIQGTAYSADQLKDRLDAGELSTYLNPYLNNVETGALDAVERSRKGALASNASKAVASKSFGGSRSAIVDALTNSEASRNAGDISNQIRAAGFQQALGAMGSDVGATNRAREFEAQTAFGARQANQQADIQSAGIRQNAAGQMQQAAKDKEASMMQKYMGQLGIGMREDELAQNRADFRYDQYLQKLYEPLNDLNIRLSAAGMTPHGQTSTSTTTGKKESSGTDWATFGLGLMKTLPGIFGMFSEDDAKTDVTKVGKDPETGLTLYAYRYKGDPKSYPKVVGPMASDIEDQDPSAVRRVGGKRIVDLEAMDW